MVFGFKLAFLKLKSKEISNDLESEDGQDSKE